MGEILNFIKILGSIGIVIVIFYIFALGIYVLLSCLTVKMVDIVEKFMEDN